MKRTLLITAAALSSAVLFGQQANKLSESEALRKQTALQTLRNSSSRIWFQENKGQFPASVQYGFNTMFGAMFVEQDALYLSVNKYHDPVNPFEKNQDSFWRETQKIRITFEGSNGRLNVVPKGLLPTKVNYFQSETPEGFVTGVRTYSELYIENVYDGIDLRLYSAANGSVEFDWILEKASDFPKIRMRAEGHEGILLRPEGGFALKCRFGDLDFKIPESYQLINGVKEQVKVSYQMGSNNDLTFEVRDVKSIDAPLVIDPTVLWATYFEQTGGDYLFASESDNCGRVYLAGRAKAAAGSGYIQGATGYSMSKGGGDVPIMYIFSADGDSIKAFTYYGNDATPQDMDLFPNGRVLVAGSRRNKNGGAAGTVPNVNAYSTATTAQGFVAIFDSEFANLLYSSHAPGTGTELGVTCVEIVDNTTYYLAGITDVAITTNGGTAATNLQFVSGSAPDNTQGGLEGYITRFTGSNFNTWQWGTYIGCSAGENFLSIKISSDQNTLAFAGNFAGATISGGLATGFPTLVNAVDNVATASEGFVGTLANSSTLPSAFGMLSYLGGSSDEDDLLVETMKHNIYVLGYTNSTDIPGIGVSGVFDGSFNGDYDAFISRIPITGSAGTGFRSTYFGGDGRDLSGGIIFNTNDSNLYLFMTTGSESSTTSPGGTACTNCYPVLNTVPPSNFYDGRHGSGNTGGYPGSRYDIVFSTITPDLTTNLFTSFCGGSDRDYLGNTGRLAGAGHYGFNRNTNIYSLGTTIHSNDLGANGSLIFSAASFDTVSAGGDDHFIVKFNLSNTDMGDAPTTYDDADPARHGTNSLGLTVAKFGPAVTDYDSKPEASIQADGDDNRNTGPLTCAPLLDDEDGLIVKPILSVETNGSYTITYAATNSTGSNANFYAWIDLDGDGVFQAHERATRIPVISNRSFLTGTTFAFSGSTITATKNSHGLAAGSWIGIAGGEGNNSVLNGLWQLSSVSANTFTFTVGSTPAGTLSAETVQPMTRDTLSWNTTGKVCPTNIKSGRTYIRMRITNSTLTDNVGTTSLDERSRGVTNSGEIEDHVLYIRGRDYGDLPASYGNASAMVFNDVDVNYTPEDTGAVWLGTRVDIETDCAANNSTQANGDDNEFSDDEDGVTFPTGPIKAGGNYNFGLTFSRSTPGVRVHYGMWVDWNADGDFTDAGDGFYNGNTTAASATVNVTAPVGTAFSPYFAVRVLAGRQAFTSGNYNLSFTNGEVEDYINDPGIIISGTVYDDGDGTYDAAIDASPVSVINKPSGVQLWAYLVNPAGTSVIDSVAVLSNGTYYLQGAAASTSGYEVRISTNRTAITTAPPAVALPANWVSVGEQYGTNNGAGSGLEALTPASNSRVSVNTGTQAVTNVDFGINLRPESFDTTAASQVNPGGSTQYPVPGLRGYDLEQGMFFGSQSRTIIVESLPGNATLYYDSDGPGGNPPVAVTLGQVINNYVASRLTVDPSFTGAGTVTFTYAWRDSAQTKDLTPATVTLPFTDPTITISGTVFDDGDGNFDNAIDGTAIGSPDGTQLYAYLDSAGVIVQRVTLPGSGTFSFSAVPSQAYQVLISSDLLTIGSAAPASSSLPPNWVNTGEQYGSPNTTGTGIEAGLANGKITVTSASNVTNVNFGINKRPESDNKTAVSQVNPGGTVQVAVPALTGSDLEDGTLPATQVRTVIIDTLPTNATLYYNGIAVTAGQVIPAYNSSLLTVDPNFNGAGTVVFRYSWRDSAQAKDLSPATVTMPFTGLTVSGTVYHDPDGLIDGQVDGTGLARTGPDRITAYLVNASNIVVDSTRVNLVNGTYLLENADANSSYTVRISTIQTAIGSTAPASASPTNGWVLTGETFGSNNAAGTGVESGAPNGRISTSTTTLNITGVDFGLEVPPYAKDKTYTLNPDSLKIITMWRFQRAIYLYNSNFTLDTTVNSLSTARRPGGLSGYDPEDGRYNGQTGVIPDTMVLRTLPDTTDALLSYYNGSTWIELWPNPQVGSPSYPYWDPVNSRYELANFDSTQLRMFVKLAYQNTTSFQYAYIDNAGIMGTTAIYTISWTSPLPVSVLKFTATLKKPSDVDLKWQTSMEEGIDHYQIYRNDPDGDRVYIGRQQARNLMVLQHYYMADNLSGGPEGMYQYQLYAAELDGTSRLAGVSVVKYLKEVQSGIRVSPVPADGEIRVSLPVEETEEGATLELLDATGKQVRLVRISGKETVIQTIDLAEGVYMLRHNLSDGRAETVKLIIQH